LEKFTDIRSEVSVFYANTYDNTLGETFVGNFSESEIADELTGQGDKLIYDLTNYEVPNDDTFYFDLKVISEQIGSAFGFYISVERADGVNYGPYTLASDIMTGKRILDQNIRIPLSLTTSNNSFVVSIHPTELNSTEKNELFASYTALANTENTYLALSGISIHGPEGFEMVHMKNSAPYDDNTYCTDGNVNYTTQPNNTITVSESMGQTNEDQGGISCGTLDISGGGGPGGPLSFVFGLSSILLMGLCSRKSNEFFV